MTPQMGRAAQLATGATPKTDVACAADYIDPAGDDAKFVSANYARVSLMSRAVRRYPELRDFLELTGQIKGQRFSPLALLLARFHILHGGKK